MVVISLMLKNTYIWASLVLITLIFPSAASLWAAPEPALVPPPGVWQLDIELHGEPRQITVNLPGDRALSKTAQQPQTRRYWYLLYTVVNNTGQDVEFYPQFELITDTLKLYQAGARERRPVFEAIREQHERAVPLIEPESMLTGKILQGDDNARDSVAIFEDFDPNAREVAIFAVGLTNETVKIDHPTDLDPQTSKPRQVLLRKTLCLKYQVPGDVHRLQNRVMLYRNRDWIMR